MLYFDYAASTPIDPRVLAVLNEAFQDYANPGATHAAALKQRQALQQARETMAEALHADPREFIFTSGATEANNLALKGALLHRDIGTPHLMTVATEHKAVLDVAAWLGTQGCRVTILPVEQDGRLNLEAVAEALQQQRPSVLSVMAVNNETGVLQDIPALADLAHHYGAKLHVDAAQALGKITVDLSAWNADAVSFSAHKIHAPVGIGALYVRRLPKMRLQAQQHGGGQERGLRSGTSPVALIRAFAYAVTLAVAELPQRLTHVLTLNQSFCKHLPPQCRRNVSHHKIPHLENLALPCLASEALAAAADWDLALSAGSACQSSQSASYVLQAMQIEAPDRALRCSFSHLTRAEEVQVLIEFLNHLCNKEQT